MLDLFYLSYTAVPSHLTELDSLGMLEQDEQILVALDGVLLDGHGKRIGGPTLHDYCLLTNLRVILWARDYGRHLCYAFPLTELCLVEGTGLDPFHAQMHLAFAAPNEEEQRFTLILLPLPDLAAGVTLFRMAAEASQEFASQGWNAREAGPEIATLLGMHIFGTEDGQPDAQSAYHKIPGDSARSQAFLPSLGQEITGLPSELYSAGRVGRAAWDAVRRTLREADLPLNLTGGDLRDITEAIRAINDLLSTIGSNPGAREMVMSLLSRRVSDVVPEAAMPWSGLASGNGRVQQASVSVSAENQAAQHQPADEVDYHEIPLRRKRQTDAGNPPADVSATDQGVPIRRREKPNQTRTAANASPPDAEHRAIPLRRRNDQRH
ncbi:MAG: hypothetical protein HC837_10450 [Chloroflexaceae bacterium]|nr:hypothetical protein [Chloroflexaceae bacterium]